MTTSLHFFSKRCCELRSWPCLYRLKQQNFLSAFNMTMVKKNTAPNETKRSEKCLPRKAVQFNAKFVNDKSLQPTSQRRRYQRRGSRSASMLLMAELSVQQHFDEPNEETAIIFMNMSPEDREDPLKTVPMTNGRILIHVSP